MKKDFRTKNLLSDFALNPEFKVVGDMVLLSPSNEIRFGTYERWRAELALNTRWALDLFVLPPSELSCRTASQACEAVRDIWKARLKSQFPDREFFVLVHYDGPPYEIMSVSFCQADGVPGWVGKKRKRQ
jgi:hypothetical protein